MVERILKFFLDFKKPEYRRLYFIVFRYLNITKTFLINFKSLPFSQAIKLPIWVYGSASFISTRGSINIDCPKIIPGMIHLGFPEDIYFNPKENGLINNDGSITFKGNFIACCGYNLRTYDGGKLIFENNIKLGAKVNIVSKNEVHIDENTRIAFEVVIIDTNFHFIQDFETKIVENSVFSIKIGKYNWIGNRSTINKGTMTPNNLIVASGSLLNKNYIKDIEEYSLLGGYPAKLLRSNVSRVWNAETELDLIKHFKCNNVNSAKFPSLKLK